MVILNETKYILSIGIFVWLATTVKGQWLVDNLGCRTPDGGSGSCILIAHCKHVTDIIRNSTKTASLPQHIINEIRSYHCGDTNNSVKVCCPTNQIKRPKIKLEQPTITELPSDDTCATPTRDVGTCIAIDKCKPITDFIRKSSPLSRTAIDTLKGYQCGPITSKVTVCCPKNEISVETPAIPDNECQTPDENIGSCIPIKDCNHITDFFHNSWPLSQNSFKLLKSYECRHQNSVNVCCPNHPILIQSVTQKLPSIIEEPHRGDTCITPDDHTGFCIPIKTCKRITDFINNSSPLSPEVIEFLQGYQCGNTTNPLNVCCPNIPISMQTIREKSPVVANHENLKLLPEECGFQIASQRIIGGTKADLFEFPWMALLSYNTENGPSFKCGGTIINERYILTAAHCISTTKLKLIGVRVGEHYIFSQRDCEQQPFGDEVCAPPVQDLAIEEIIPHPKYNNITFINDIGLIRLASPIDTTVENAKPICLPITEELRTHNFTNTNLTVTGWGNTEAGHKSADLLKVSVPVIPEETCRKAYNNTSVLINKVKQICAGGKQKSDSCTGDSGGPLQMMLFYNYDIRSVQFGVVSFGPKRCGQEGIPGVYTKVDYYMDWILDNIKP